MLLQVAQALQCTLADLVVGEPVAQSPERGAILGLLAQRDETALRRARLALSELLGARPPSRAGRVALIGLRGAGKSTLGLRLAQDLGFPFIELSREIERIAGCEIAEIQALYGQNGYRRYERSALDEAIQSHPRWVLAAPGGLVSKPETFDHLLAHCTTVWLRADPQDHMMRVIAQGDLRPMAANPQAMADLKAILAGRAAFYSKATLQIDITALPLEPTFAVLRKQVRGALNLPIRETA